LTNKEKYIAYANSAKDIPIYLLPKWLAITNHDSWDVYIGTVNNKEAYLVYCYFSKYGFSRLVLPVMVPYTLWQCSQPLLPAETKELTDSFINNYNAVHWLELPLLNANHLANNTITQKLNLLIGKDKLYNNIKPTQQRHIKYATKNYALSNNYTTEQLWNILETTSHNKNFATGLNKTILHNLIQWCNSNTKAKLLVAANKNEDVLGFVLITIHPTEATFVLGATLQNENTRGAAAWLHWQAINYCQSIGIATYNFEGSEVSGVNNFYKTFGTTQEKLPLLHIVNNKVAKLLHSVLKKLA
jgi:hypothetical protein